MHCHDTAVLLIICLLLSVDFKHAALAPCLNSHIAWLHMQTGELPPTRTRLARLLLHADTLGGKPFDGGLGPAWTGWTCIR